MCDFVCILFLLLVDIMEIFSLEEEDYGDIFITQQPNKDRECQQSRNLLDRNAFSEGSMDVGVHYSDISDDESEVFQSSQITNGINRGTEK